MVLISSASEASEGLTPSEEDVVVAVVVGEEGVREMGEGGEDNRQGRVGETGGEMFMLSCVIGDLECLAMVA